MRTRRRIVFSLALGVLLLARVASVEAVVSIASFTTTEIGSDSVSLSVTFNNPNETSLEVRTAWRVVDGAWEDGAVVTARQSATYTVTGLAWGTGYQFRAEAYPLGESSPAAQSTTYATTATPPSAVPDTPARPDRPSVFDRLGGVTVRVGCSQDGSECGYRSGEYGGIAGALPGALFQDGQPRAPTAAYEVRRDGSVRWVFDVGRGERVHVG